MIFRAQNPGKKPILARIIGPETDVKEISIVIGLNDKNSIPAMLMLSACAKVATPQWADSEKWVMETITDLAKEDGGNAEKKVAGKMIRIQVSKPNLLALNIRVGRQGR